MSFRTTKNELKERLELIKDNLECSSKDMKILENVIDSDIEGISIILIDEGIIRGILYQIEDTELRYLKEYSKDYNTFKKYYNMKTVDWDFLNEEQLIILKNLNKLYLKYVQKYFEDRGDLMIFRKTINNFIESTIKDFNNVKEVRSYLLNNYSYHDTIYNFGLDASIEDGLLKLTRLHLNKEGFLDI